MYMYIICHIISCNFILLIDSDLPSATSNMKTPGYFKRKIRKAPPGLPPTDPNGRSSKPSVPSLMNVKSRLLDSVHK